MRINGILTSITVSDKGAKLTIEASGISEKGIVEELAIWASTSQELNLVISEDRTQTKIDVNMIAKHVNKEVSK